MTANELLNNINAKIRECVREDKVGTYNLLDGAPAIFPSPIKYLLIDIRTAGFFENCDLDIVCGRDDGKTLIVEYVSGENDSNHFQEISNRIALISQFLYGSDEFISTKKFTTDREIPTKIISSDEFEEKEKGEKDEQ